MKCIEKIYRKEGCARNGHFGVPKSIYRAQKKKTMTGSSVLHHVIVYIQILRATTIFRFPGKMAKITCREKIKGGGPQIDNFPGGGGAFV